MTIVKRWAKALVAMTLTMAGQVVAEYLGLPDAAPVTDALADLFEKALVASGVGAATWLVPNKPAPKRPAEPAAWGDAGPVQCAPAAVVLALALLVLAGCASTGPAARCDFYKAAQIAAQQNLELERSRRFPNPYVMRGLELSIVNLNVPIAVACGKAAADPPAD